MRNDRSSRRLTPVAARVMVMPAERRDRDSIQACWMVIWWAESAVRDAGARRALRLCAPTSRSPWREWPRAAAAHEGGRRWRGEYVKRRASPVDRTVEIRLTLFADNQVHLERTIDRSPLRLALATRRARI